MSKLDEKDDEMYEPPEWLMDALEASRPAILSADLEDEPAQEGDTAFISRCHQAAEVAFSITRLRAERQLIGFVPLTFADYINGLVKLANIPIAPVLSWLGLDDISKLEPKSAKVFARLARHIGMSMNEALAHLRISFAAQVGAAPVSLLVARHRSVGSQQTPLEKSVATLRQIESEYDLDKLKELRRIEAEVNAAYEMGGNHRA